MPFLLRKKVPSTNNKAKEAEAAAASANRQGPKVVTGEALSAMSIQYDSDRIKQTPTYQQPAASSLSSPSTPATAHPAMTQQYAARPGTKGLASPPIPAASLEPIDQRLAKTISHDRDETYVRGLAIIDADRKGSTSTAKPYGVRRSSSGHASVASYAHTLPPAQASSSYYHHTPSPQIPAPAASSSNAYSNASTSYGYYRSPKIDDLQRSSLSSESSYAASEASDILHNSVGGRSSSGGTTATTPGSTTDKDPYGIPTRKNSLAGSRQISIERVPVPSHVSQTVQPQQQLPQSTNSPQQGRQIQGQGPSGMVVPRPRPISEVPSERSQASPALSSASSFVRKTASRYTLGDFNFQRTLGTGSFGRVHLVRSCHNMRFYAVKVLNKERVVRMKQVEHTNSEREMLERVRHPFLVNLWGTFKDSQNLYMVMDFVSGGELFSLLRKSQRFPDAVAKFFAAEVALALDYLHSLDIIYRDLKPENILLAADGHVKITDFGFAKYVPDITWTLCGTPDYLAPEIVQSKGYNKSVDWYALGVLIFEMLAGYPPFFTEDSNPMRLYEKIIAGKVRYPSYFTEEAKDLLRNLLTGDLTKRFGNLANGSRDIFGHAYFTEVDWNRLYRKEIPAPYVPKVDGDGDSSNFDTYAEIDVSEYGQAGADTHGHLFTCF